MQVRQPILVETPKVSRNGWSVQSSDNSNNRRIDHDTSNKDIPDHWVKNALQTDVKVKTPEWRMLGLKIAGYHGEQGLQLFRAVSLNNSDWLDDTEDIIDAYYQKFLGEADPEKSSRNAVIKALESAGILLRIFSDHRPKGAFWNVKVTYKRGSNEPVEKLICDSSKIFRETLPVLGFSINEDGDYVHEVSPGRLEYDVNILYIKQALKRFIREQDGPLYAQLYEFITKPANMPSKVNLEYLPMKLLPILRSTSKTIYLYFLDGVLSIDRASGEQKLIQYSELKGFYVPVKAIMPVKFSNLSPEKAEDATFNEFLKLISYIYTSSLLVIGYLIDDYKDEANPKTIIITDCEATLDGNSHGGTGKDLLVKTIVQVVKLFTKISGKRFDPNSSFNLQLFKMGSQLLWIEDLKKNIKEEVFFTMTTSDLEVERKHKQAISIPASESPKIVITTNYPLVGTGASSKRRFYVLELKPYFDNSHTPLDEFGKRFISEWDDEETQRFYSLIVFVALPKYLEVGLTSEPYSNAYRRNQVISQSNEEVFEFFESIDLNEFQSEDDIANLRNKFGKNCGEDLEKKIKGNPGLFTKWLRVYVEVFLQMKLKTRKSNSKTLYHVEAAE